MWSQKFFEKVARGLTFAVAGAVMLQLFAVLLGVAAGLMPEQSYPPSLIKILYSLTIICPLYFVVGLVLFFLVGVATRQNLLFVLKRCARTMALFLPCATLLCVIGGAIWGHLCIAGSTESEAGWLSGANMGMMLGFPVGLLAALCFSVVRLRREHH